MKSLKVNNAEKLKALLEKGEALPYKQIAKRFVKITVDPKKSRNCFCNKSIRQGLVAFGDYLESKKVIIPLKVDVIDFIFQKRNENERTLQWYFGVCMEFVLFCQKNYFALFDGILLGTGVKRLIETIDGSIITCMKWCFLMKRRMHSYGMQLSFYRIT